MGRSRQWILVVLSLPALAGCAMMDRSSSSYTSNYDDDEYAAYAAQRNGTAQALDELGWSPTRPLSAEERDTLEKRIRLNRLERSLTSRKEREQYYRFKPYLDSDDDKIQFLSLPTMEARDRFAMDKGIYNHPANFSPTVKAAISRSDIILGMNKEAVIESWGEPQDVEVAGDAMYGNERWTYSEYTPNPEGYEREDRVVIFEGGKVVGWQKQ